MKINTYSSIAMAIGVAVASLSIGTARGQVTMIPSTYVKPASTADTNSVGFIWNVSEVLNSEPNLLVWAQEQLDGLEGINYADPTQLGPNAASTGNVALTNANPANPPTAPISFIIPGIINMSKAVSTAHGNFQPDDQMPGIPGTGANDGTDNIAAELLTYLLLPAGTITMGVNSDDGFRMTIGGATPGDQFAVNVGQFDGGRGANNTIFQFQIPQAGLYAARVLYENGGGDADIEWFTVTDGLNGTNFVLINDLANGGVPAYYALTTGASAYAQLIDPIPNSTGVSPNEGLHVVIIDGSTPVPSSSIILSLDGTAVTPVITKSGSTNKIDYALSSNWAPGSQHSAFVVFLDGALHVTNNWSFTVQKYVTLDPNWRVTGVDTNKAGFNWNIFANADTGNQVNSDERAEKDLSLLAIGALGDILPNLADPTAVGGAVGPGVAGPSNAPVHFEIATTISLDIANTNMPGAPSTDQSTDGQAAEVLTYLNLPVGIIQMQIDADDGWRLYSGAQPADIFGRAVVAEANGPAASGPTSFSFNVTQAGYYPFRLIWENGTGGSRLNWRTVVSPGQMAFVNDVTNGGTPAYRALVSGTAVNPYVSGVNPAPAIHQLEVYDTNMFVVLVDGTKAINDSSVTLTVDGNTVTPVTQRFGNLLTVGDNGAAVPGFSLAGDVHTATLTYRDTTGAYSRTQQWTFDNIQNLVIPTNPVVLENFDEYPEATSVSNTVPPGWTNWNYTFENTPGWDLTIKGSDSFKNFVVISTTTMEGVEGGTSGYDMNTLINGQPADSIDPFTGFFSGNVLWATSDGRNGVQAQFCASAPFDLSSVTNPVMLFSSILRMSNGGNAQTDAIEYSIDGGNTWLPGIIYVTIAYTTPGTIQLTEDGSIDAVSTLNIKNPNMIWVDPITKLNAGGTYGSGLAEPITQSLAAYIAPRSEITTTSEKVDGFRLPMASKQKDVRLRFSQLGNCSWWWGVDNLAFYDIAPPTTSGGGSAPNITSVTTAGGHVTVQWTGGGLLQSATSLSTPNWTSTGNSSGSFTEAVSTSGSKFYRVAK